MGRRLEYVQSFTGVAVDVDLTPTWHFTLIDVVVNLNTAATTSENLTISTKSTDGTKTRLEASSDLSTLSAPEATSKVFRFDKRFTKTMKLEIDYTNTDARNIDVIIQYELDSETD